MKSNRFVGEYAHFQAVFTRRMKAIDGADGADGWGGAGWWGMGRRVVARRFGPNPSRVISARLRR